MPYDVVLGFDLPSSGSMTSGATLAVRTLLVHRHRRANSHVWRSSRPHAQADMNQASECHSTDSLDLCSGPTRA